MNTRFNRFVALFSLVVGAVMVWGEALGFFPKPAPGDSLVARDIFQDLGWFVFGIGLIVGGFSLLSHPTLHQLMIFAPAALITAALIVGLVESNTEGTLVSLFLLVLWFWGRVAEAENPINARVALGRGFFLIGCVFSAFFSAVTLIGFTGGSPWHMAPYFASMSAGFFASGWLLRYLLSRV